MSANDKYDGTKSGIRTEDLAWEHIKQQRCDYCTDDYAPCDDEWDVMTDEEYYDLLNEEE